MPVALQARAVSRSFRGFRALDHVDLSVEEGEIHAILGPNGAGKTTLFNCLSGFLQPTEGTVELFGETIAGLPPHKLNRVEAYIREHFAETIQIQQLADIVHMSPCHFARMFKKAIGQPPHLYVVMQRVERARTLLRDSEQALIDIAAQAGFRTQGHFTGVFRRYTGLTPRAYRLDCRAAQA